MRALMTLKATARLRIRYPDAVTRSALSARATRLSLSFPNLLPPVVRKLLARATLALDRSNVSRRQNPAPGSWIGISAQGLEMFRLTARANPHLNHSGCLRSSPGLKRAFVIRSPQGCLGGSPEPAQVRLAGRRTLPTP